MRKTPMQLLQKILLENYPNDMHLKELLELSIIHEKALIENAFVSGEFNNSIKSKGLEPITSGQYYSINYTQND